MQLKTILNSVTDYKSFVFTKVWKDIFPDTNEEVIVAEIEPRKNARGVCLECGRKCPTENTARQHRWFEFVPLWNIPVWFAYKMRRVKCPEHGIVTEKVPWGDGKNTQTVEHRQFLANWAKRLSWKETAECFGTTLGKVHRAVEWIVNWGLSGVTKIGVDEFSRSRGHKYVTLVYQLDDGKRLLGVEKDRNEKSLERFFDTFDEGTEGEDLRSKKIEFVCSDMLKAYLNVIEKRCSNALNILDRFHVKGHLTKAVDETRKLDVAKLKLKKKEKVLTKSKYIFLKNLENLKSRRSKVELSDNVQYIVLFIKKLTSASFARSVAQFKCCG